MKSTAAKGLEIAKKNNRSKKDFNNKRDQLFQLYKKYFSDVMPQIPSRQDTPIEPG